jgi:hypothetical protein
MYYYMRDVSLFIAIETFVSDSGFIHQRKVALGETYFLVSPVDK